MKSPICTWLFGAFVLLALSTVARADLIIRDHVTEESLWQDTFNCYNHSEGGVPSLDGWAASAFRGNGYSTSWVEGLFVTEKQGIPNNGNLSLKDFRVVFYADYNAFAAPSWRDGTLNVLFDTPSNPGWDSPIGQAEGWDVYRLRFEVAFPTVLDQVHYFSIVPVGSSSVSGVSMLRFSTGGQGAIGLDLDVFRDANGLGPGTLQGLGAPYDYVATSVALVPGPATGVAMVLLTPWVLRRRRRS